MAATPPEARDAFRADLIASVQESSTAGNIRRAQHRGSVWTVWARFCAEHNLSETLDRVNDPVPILAAFARRYRDGRIAIRGQPIRGRSVEDVVRQVARTFTELGADDPRLAAGGDQDLRLSGLWRHYRHQDPPPNRVKPIPRAVLLTAYRLAAESCNPADQCLADMLWVALFFLCRPGEYTADAEESRPFRFQDTQLWLGARSLDKRTASEAELLAATCSALVFTNQKNCVPGEVIAQGTSGSATACPTHSIARRILHLRAHNAPDDTPLCSYFEEGEWWTITPPMITSLLRAAAAAVGPSVGFHPNEISARSLRASGAMAMLCGGIDPTVIRLRGRWRSDTMLRYLTVQAAPFVADVAARMLSGGEYALVPGRIDQGADAAVPAPAGAAAPQPAAPTVAAAAAAIAAANPPAPAA